MARQYLYILTVVPLLIQHLYYNRQVVDLEQEAQDSSKHVIETADTLGLNRDAKLQEITDIIREKMQESAEKLMEEISTSFLDKNALNGKAFQKQFKTSKQSGSLAMMKERFSDEPNKLQGKIYVYILQMLAFNTDAKLREITDFSREKLQESIEECVDVISTSLLVNKALNNKEYQRIRKLAENNRTKDASQMIFDNVLEKGSREERIIWIILLQKHFATPKLYGTLEMIEARFPDVTRNLQDNADTNLLQMLASWTDIEMTTATYFIRPSIEQLIEHFVVGISQSLFDANVFSSTDLKRIGILAELKHLNDASQMILDILLLNGTHGERCFWRQLIQLRNLTPKLKAILAEKQTTDSGGYAVPLGLFELTAMITWMVGSMRKWWHTEEITNNNISWRSEAGGNSTAKFLPMLATYTDVELCMLTDIYRNELVKSVETNVEAFSRSLLNANVLTNREHKKICSLAGNERRNSASQMIFDIVLERGTKARTTTWDTFAKMQVNNPELRKILSEISEKGSKVQMELICNELTPEIANCIWETHFRHREHVLQKTKSLIDIITGAERYNLIDDNFTNIMIAAPLRDRSVVENEVKALGRMREELQSKNILQEYTLGQLFSGSSGKACRNWATLVIGAAGIGKSTLIQKMIREWAQGKIYKQFAFVFHFKFLELNLITFRTNLTNLILDSYPYLENVLDLLWEEPTQLLFIFDDIDRFEQTVHFTDFQIGKDQQTHGFDPASYCEVSEIVRRLVQGELVKGCSVLITTRPWQLELFEKASIDLTVEIRGFTSEQTKLYFQQCYNGEQFATEVTEYIRRNEVLSTMCYNPLYCSVLSSLFAPHLTQWVERRCFSSITSTQVFCSYVTNLLDRCVSDREHATDALLKMGEMAFQGICNQSFVYKKSQFNYHKLKLSNVILTFMMEVPEKDRGGVVYTFTHSILQHFAAALVKTKLTPGKQVILLLREWNLCPDDRFKIVSNFLVGLSSKNPTVQLMSKMIMFNTEAQTYVSDWLEENIKNKVQHLEEGKTQNKLLTMLNYLLEFGDANLMTVALTPTNIVKIRHCPLTYSDCLVLSSVLMKVDQIEELNIGSCDIQADGMRQLEHLLSKCKIVRLNDNKLGDSGLNLISAVLKKLDCKIQRLELKSNKLSDDCVEMLASSLSENGSLRELDLSNDDMAGDQANCLTDKSVPALKRLMENCSNLKEIRLTHNQLSAAGKNTLKQQHVSDQLTVIA